MSGPLWGVDLGGTKTEGVVLPSAESREPLCRLRIPTDARLGYETIVQRVCQVVQTMEEQCGLKCPALGIGTPGAVDPPTQTMKNCNTTVLNGKPLHRDLKAALNRNVIVENDANCFALAEAKLGAARGGKVVFGVIMGTGVGGGIVVNGQTLSGVQGIAGEWGHNVLDPDGERCYCGKRGCVETVLSGPGLERHYRTISGASLPLKDIVDRARSGEPAAQETLRRLTSKFGEAISVVVNILDPDTIVLGGGVGNIDELYTEGRSSLAQWVFNRRLDTKLVRPELGDSAGVFGAALLARG